MTEYGLPVPRTKDGDLKPVDHTYEYQEREVTIRLIPPTVSDYQEYEELGMDASAEDLIEVVGQHLVEPEVNPDDLTMRELMCYVEGIVDYAAGGDEMHELVQEELEKRVGEGDTGNSTQPKASPSS